MATYSGYTFDNMSRIGLDSCCVDQSTLQNTAACNYMLQNYNAGDCTMKGARQLAMSQPGIMLNGGFGSGAGGCNIDKSSELLIGAIQTSPACRIDLFSRPFATVPYLGRGTVNPMTESYIQQGEQFSKRKSASGICEQSTMSWNYVPLQSDVKQHMANKQIESDAYAKWVRGGVDTRGITRDVNYA